jgi:branched-chain amino acid transport system permease protein
MADFANILITGILVGLLYAMVAMGFVVIYRASKIFNFAQGELLVLSGFIIWTLAREVGLPVFASGALGLVAAAGIGYIIERIFFSRLVGESPFSMVMVTLALLILIRGVILVIWGPDVRAFPAVFPLKPVIIGDIFVPTALIYGGGISIACALGVSWFFGNTRLGLALTAVSEDHQVALSLGISVRKAMTFAWVLGSVLSALACLIYLSGRSLNFLVSDIGFTALPVALLAGLESVGGLIPAGMLVGGAQLLAQFYLNPLIGADVASIVPYLVILLVLFLRPTGLFGWKRIERV